MTTALAILCFALAALGLIGINVFYCRALARETRRADENDAMALSWQHAAAVLVEEAERDGRWRNPKMAADDEMFLPEINWDVK